MRTFYGLLMTRETVAGETPARRATSRTPLLAAAGLPCFVIMSARHLCIVASQCQVMPQFYRTNHCNLFHLETGFKKTDDGPVPLRGETDCHLPTPWLP
jgi:hypothetical protein